MIKIDDVQKIITELDSKRKELKKEAIESQKIGNRNTSLYLEGKCSSLSFSIQKILKLSPELKVL